MENIYKIGDIKEEPVKKEKFKENTTKNDFNKTKFVFKNDLDSKNKNNNEKKDESDDEISLIQLDRDLEYYYRLYYFDENMREYVSQYKDSINFIQIIILLKDQKHYLLKGQTRSKLTNLFLWIHSNKK